MKQILNLQIYKSWRVDVLLVLTVVGLILLLGDTDDLAALAWSKIAAVADFCIVVALWTKWDAAGKLDGIKELCTEE